MLLEPLASACRSALIHSGAENRQAKTAVLSRVGRFQLKDIPVPALKEGELRLKVLSAGICGTDIRIFTGAKTMGLYPADAEGCITKDLVLGHEFVGEIVELNGPALPFSAGQKVFVEPDIFCNNCDYCGAGATNMCGSPEVIFEHYPGAFSQFLTVPAKAVSNRQVHPVPENLPVDQGSLIEPLACVVHGQERLLKLLPMRRSALIIGAGPIGMLHAMLAKENSFKDISVLDINPDRVKLLQGIFSGIDNVKISHAPSAASWDRIIGKGQHDMIIHACADISALQEGLKKVAPSGGALAFAGVKKGDSIQVDAHRLHYGDIHIIGSSNYTTPDIMRSIKLLSGRAVPGSLFVSDTFPLERVQDAMELAISGKALKVVLKPNG